MLRGSWGCTALVAGGEAAGSGEWAARGSSGRGTSLDFTEAVGATGGLSLGRTTGCCVQGGSLRFRKSGWILCRGSEDTQVATDWIRWEQLGCRWQVLSASTEGTGRNGLQAVM